MPAVISGHRRREVLHRPVLQEAGGVDGLDGHRDVDQGRLGRAHRLAAK